MSRVYICTVSFLRSIERDESRRHTGAVRRILLASSRPTVSRSKARQRQIGGQSKFQRLDQLNGLPNSILGCRSMRISALVACFIAITGASCSQGRQEVGASGSRLDTGEAADSADSEYPKEAWGKYLKPSRGEILVPRGKIQAWEKFPSGLFLAKGARVVEFDTDLRLRVIEARKLAFLLSDERYYLKVEPEDSNSCAAAKCFEVSCWVFQGQADAELPENLLPPNTKLPNSVSP